MNYWYLLTQNHIYPKDTNISNYIDKMKTVVVVTKDDTMPARLMKETNWIGTVENDEGHTKVTLLMGWSQLNEKAFDAIKTRVDVIWYVDEDKWEWPCMEEKAAYLTADYPPDDTLTEYAALQATTYSSPTFPAPATTGPGSFFTSSTWATPPLTAKKKISKQSMGVGTLKKKLKATEDF